MPRREFSVQTKRAAYKRSGGHCQKCGIHFDSKIRPEYDHIIMDALSGDNSLANCQVLCRKCHSEKTNGKDKPTAAKTKRLADAKMGIKHKGSLKRGKNKKKILPFRRGGIAAQFGLEDEIGFKK